VVALLAAPAQAQADEAFITVDQAHPATGSTHYFVSVTDAEGSPITDTEVVATPIDPDGGERDPVTLDSSGDGIYQGLVPMNDPGEWTIRFTTADPPGSTDHVQQVAAANTSIESVPPTDSDVTIEPTPDTTAPATEEATDEDSDSNALPLILLLAALLAAAAIATTLFLRTRNKTQHNIDT